MTTQLATILDIINTFDSNSGNIGNPTSLGLKTAGGVNISQEAAGWRWASGDPPTGLRWNMPATPRDFTNYLALVAFSYNAPNRVQLISVTGSGMTMRIGSTIGLTNNYKEWNIGGNDTERGLSPENKAIVIDPASFANSGSVGTFNIASVEEYAVLHRWGQNPPGNGQTGNGFISRFGIIGKTKSTAPRVYGTNCTLKELHDDTRNPANIFHANASKIGNTYFLGMPFTIGFSASSATTFTDEGFSFVSPENNELTDPRYHLTSQSMQVFLDLRATDTASFSGSYNWGTKTTFHFDSNEGAKVLFSDPTFDGIGYFDVNSDVSGSATFVECDTIALSGSANLNGSTFTRCGSIKIRGDIKNYTVRNCTTGIFISQSGTYEFDNVQFSNNTNDVTVDHPSGEVTINLVNGSDDPTVNNTGGGTYTVNRNVTLTFNNLISGSRIRVNNSDTEAEILNQAVSASTLNYVYSYTADENVSVVVRKSSSPPKYQPFTTTGTITINGMTITINQVLDTIAS